MGIGGLSRHQLTFPIRKTFMRRSIVSLFSFLAIALITLTGCQEPQNSIPGSVDSISVRVMDSTDAKTITPEGNVNISHYVITVVNEAEGISQSSGYLTKGSMFTVSNVPAGTWYAKVDAYIDRGEDTYVKVASDQSEPKTVQAGTSTTFELVLDTLDAVASGDVTVTLKMPAALSAESTAFWYQYTITGLTDEEFTHTSEMLSGTTGADGLATITLDADAIGLMQGAYRFAITVQDAETSPTLTRKGMDVMRLVNRLEAKGTIDLSGYEADQSFEITVTDKIGDILTPSIKDGKEVYNLDGQDGSASLTVTLDEPLSDTETIEWYVDGELDEAVNADLAIEGKYTLTFTAGKHIITAIVKDTESLMAVGSVNLFMVDIQNITLAVYPTEWTQVTGVDAFDIACGNGLCVAVNRSGSTASVANLSDLSQWDTFTTGIGSGSAYPNANIKYGNGFFVINADGGQAVSDDGRIWRKLDFADIPEDYIVVSGTPWVFNDEIVLHICYTDWSTRPSVVYHGFAITSDGEEWRYEMFPNSGDYVFFASNNEFLAFSKEDGVILKTEDFKEWVEAPEMKALADEFVKIFAQFEGVGLIDAFTDNNCLYIVLGYSQNAPSEWNSEPNAICYDKNTRTVKRLMVSTSGYTSGSGTTFCAANGLLVDLSIDSTGVRPIYSNDNGETWTGYESNGFLSDGYYYNRALYDGNRFFMTLGDSILYSNEC